VTDVPRTWSSDWSVVPDGAAASRAWTTSSSAPASRSARNADSRSAFLGDLDAGALDDVVQARLAAAQSGTTLQSLDQVRGTSVT